MQKISEQAEVDNLSVTLSSTIETRLLDEAKAKGLTPDELLSKLLVSPLQQKLSLSEKAKAHKNLFAEWLYTAQTATPDQLTQGEVEWDQQKTNMNSSREAEGRIKLFP